MKTKIPNTPSHPNMIGSKNPRWKGGISTYPNQGLMKRMRKAILKEKNGKCEICGGKGTQIHHLDKTKTNHDRANLILVCPKCHMNVFHKDALDLTAAKKAPKKYEKAYGLTLKQISKLIHRKPATVIRLHREGKLQPLLNQQSITLSAA